MLDIFAQGSLKFLRHPKHVDILGGQYWRIPVMKVAGLGSGYGGFWKGMLTDNGKEVLLLFSVFGELLDCEN